jgi:hypothetical protein
VPFQLVATNVGQPRSEVLFEIAPSSSRFQATLSPAGVVNAQTSRIVDQTQGPAMSGGTHYAGAVFLQPRSQVAGAADVEFPILLNKT